MIFQRGSAAFVNRVTDFLSRCCQATGPGPH